MYLYTAFFGTLEYLQPNCKSMKPKFNKTGATVNSYYTCCYTGRYEASKLSKDMRFCVYRHWVSSHTLVCSYIISTDLLSDVAERGLES